MVSSLAHLGIHGFPTLRPEAEKTHPPTGYGRQSSRISGQHVFLSADGLPLSEETVRRYFAVAKQLAGITRRLRFHDLRHTFKSSRPLVCRTLAREFGLGITLRRAGTAPGSQARLTQTSGGTSPGTQASRISRAHPLISPYRFTNLPSDVRKRRRGAAPSTELS